ncbi:MAG: histidine kinase [Acidobacteriaceae bacterium]|nr:histidine kinase [Acidobacteriaceae bacterium]
MSGKILIPWIRRIAIGSFFLAAVVPLMEWCFNPRVRVADIREDYLLSLVYAFFIGSLLTSSVGTVWARTCAWPIVWRWAGRAVAVSLATAAGTLMAGLVALIVYGHRYAFWPSFVYSFRIGLLIAVVTIAFVSMYEKQKSRLQATAVELKTKEVDRERALKLATEARLSSLQSRIHPHFLFNTINSVSSLIHEDPQRAERLLMQMAALLRFSLDSAHTGLVPLEREIKIVEDYLEIEKARFGDRLRYELDLPPGLERVAVPPLSLQTLVENSVKYAVSPRAGGATVFIYVRRNVNVVELEVRDDGPGFRNAELPAGHGLNNLQERLIALFKDEAVLEIESNHQGSCVRIGLPYATEARAADARRQAPAVS